MTVACFAVVSSPGKYSFAVQTSFMVEKSINYSTMIHVDEDRYEDSY
jgi:hypothetical protein